MGESQLLLLLRLLLLPTVLFGWMDSAGASTADIYKGARLGHRIVQTRYGRLHGLILPLDSFRFLRSVEVFLGVPYATPPTKQNRFSPTRAPAPWDGIRISDKYSPVCPQRLPNIQNETAALEKMPKGRLEYLKRLLPFLENQSEDCLYLNVFSPVNAGANEKKLPVIVFIHGESFEWSSGNPYDGSVLASYGEVVVVTLNYRLGILGFLNANPNPHAHARVANYGLMDQMAALHWIQQNIQKFGGDPNSVTLAGHGTGAACINYLMTSPTMVRGLFHRAILMSGSAYSSWALVEDPVLFAIKLAKEVNCTIPDDINRHHEQIVDCLRDVPLEDLYMADIQAPNFLTSFGPSVDGVVIRPGHSNLDIDDLMARNSRRSSADSGFQSSAGGGGGQGGGAGGGGGGGSGSAFGGGYFGGGGAGAMNMGGHYDVLFGVVTGESIWRFSAHDIQNGFEGERRDKIIRTYVRNAYNYHLNEIFYTIVNEYTDWDRTSQHPINTRDTAVAALSDAQFVAPIVRAGDILAANSPPPVSSSSPADRSAGANAAASTSAGSTQPSGRCYFYVFDYQTKDGDYPQRMGTVHGEDLPYIFGAPLVDGFSHFPQNYTKSETALSEAVMIFWTNFARTGNPNEHHRQDSSLPVSKERNRFRSITWENYDPLHQKYLEIGMKPRIKNHFRAHQLSIWLRLIPELHRAGMEDVIARHNLFRNHDDMDLYEGPVKPDPFGISTAAGATGSSSSSSSSSRLLLVDEQLMMKKGRGLNASAYLNGILGVTTVEPNNMYTTCIPIGGNYSSSGGVFAPTTLANASSDTLASGFEAAGYAAYSTALSVTIAIGCSLLILNVLIFAGVYYQRDKTRLEVKTLQKQYQQRSLHQQVPYPPEPIKHAHYHMGHSQSSANVIVDVESHQDQAGQAAMLLQAAAAAAAAAASEVKPPPPHICSNTGMQQVGGGSGGALNNGGIEGSKVTTDNLGNVTYSTSSKQQQQHQQQREHMQIKGMTGTQTFGRSGSGSGSGAGGGGGSASGGASVVVSGSSVSYNPGMMTLPKSGGLHHAATLNYARNTAALNMSGGGTALVDSRGNVLLTSTAVGPGMGGTGAGGGSSGGGGGGDCMTLPRNLSLAAAGRHNPTTADLQQYQQQQQSSKHQSNGTVLTGMQSHHIRGPRPPLRTASSTTTNSSSNNSAMGVAVGGGGGVGVGVGVGNMLLDQTPSGGSSSSGVSSAPSSSKGHHTHSHSHAAHLVHSHGDGLVLTSASPVGGQQQQHPQQHQHPQQQQVPQAAMDEMRV